MTKQDEFILACAQAAHEANRAYCAAIGDNSQFPWEAAPDWQRTSAVNGVRGILDGNGPAQAHESWLEEKKAAGWKFGLTKDPEKREHPYLVPYRDLPKEQKQKDKLFVMTVRSVASVLGMKITYPDGETIDWSVAEVAIR